MSKNERRFDPKSLEKLEAPERAEQFPVAAILDAAGVCGMLNVADIGAGSGYFTLPIGARVAPGKVYAVEPSAELLEVIRVKLAADHAPKNAELLVGEDSATGLAKASCDLIFLSAVWHEIDDHGAALREFLRIAAPNAKQQSWTGARTRCLRRDPLWSIGLHARRWRGCWRKAAGGW